MKEKMSLNRNRDRDITAHQPLLDELSHSQQQQQYSHHTDNDETHLVDCDGTVGSNSIPNGLLQQNALSGSSVAGTIAGTMAAASARHSGTKYSKLENAVDSPGHYGAAALDSPGHRFVGETVSVQQRMIQDQDEQLDMIGNTIGTLKTVSRQIGAELEEQAVMLDDFSTEFDTTESKLDSTMKKVAKVLHMNNDKRQWLTILILSTLLFIVIILFIIL